MESCIKIGNYIIGPWEFDLWSSINVRHIRLYSNPNLLIGSIFLSPGANNIYYLYFSHNNPFTKVYNLTYEPEVFIEHNGEIFSSLETAQDRVDLFINKLSKLIMFS